MAKRRDDLVSSDPFAGAKLVEGAFQRALQAALLLGVQRILIGGDKIQLGAIRQIRRLIDQNAAVFHAGTEGCGHEAIIAPLAFASSGTQFDPTAVGNRHCVAAS